MVSKRLDTLTVNEKARARLVCQLVEARVAFRNAILAAQRAGIDNAEIAHVTGLTVRMIAAVLRTP